MNDTTIAVDVAKTVFEVAVSAQPGHVTSGIACRARALPACWAHSARRPS